MQGPNMGALWTCLSMESSVRTLPRVTMRSSMTNRFLRSSSLGRHMGRSGEGSYNSLPQGQGSSYYLLSGASHLHVGHAWQAEYCLWSCGKLWHANVKVLSGHPVKRRVHLQLLDPCWGGLEWYQDKIPHPSGNEVVATSMYGDLKPGSSRVKICLWNLTSQKVTIPAQCVIGQIQVVNEVPGMYAPVTSKGHLISHVAIQNNENWLSSEPAASEEIESDQLLQSRFYSGLHSQIQDGMREMFRNSAYDVTAIMKAAWDLEQEHALDWGQWQVTAKVALAGDQRNSPSRSEVNTKLCQRLSHRWEPSQRR